MLNDFKTLTACGTLRYDVIIVGSGAAGIPLALELADRGFEVGLFEGGGLEMDIDSQEMYEGDVVGLDYPSLDTVRARYLGGTTNLWTGRALKLDPIDFRVRDWMPMSGWPIDRATLDPYYAEARNWIELDALFDDDSFWRHHDISIPEFEPLGLQATVDQKSPPTRFGPKYLAQLKSHARVHLWLNANLTAIDFDEAGRQVSAITLSTVDGRHCEARATAIVLACGGIENARILLANRERFPTGIGNQHDLVGRYFADHAHMVIGEIKASDPVALLDRLGPQFRDGVKYTPRFQLTEAAQEQYRAGNCTLWLHPRQDRSSGGGAMIELYNDWRHHGWPHDGMRRLGQIASDPLDVLDMAYRRLVLGHQTLSKVDAILLVGNIDQVPRADSRVSLTDERDALGIPRCQLDWRMSEADLLSLRQLAQGFAGVLAEAGLGRLQLHDWFTQASGDAWLDAFLNSENSRLFADVATISFHHMGTTRMAADPRHGVVDANNKVHGIDNLFIAGSSVFTTYGGAQPTLSIVALSLRLRDHLANWLPQHS